MEAASLNEGLPSSFPGKGKHSLSPPPSFDSPDNRCRAKFGIKQLYPKNERTENLLVVGFSAAMMIIAVALNLTFDLPIGSTRLLTEDNVMGKLIVYNIVAGIPVSCAVAVISSYHLRKFQANDTAGFKYEIPAAIGIVIICAGVGLGVAYVSFKAVLWIEFGFTQIGLYISSTRYSVRKIRMRNCCRRANVIPHKSSNASELDITWSLDTVLHKRDGMATFFKFLRREFCGEILVFWRNVSMLRIKFKKSLQVLKQQRIEMREAEQNHPNQPTSDAQMKTKIMRALELLRSADPVVSEAMATRY